MSKLVKSLASLMLSAVYCCANQAVAQEGSIAFYAKSENPKNSNNAKCQNCAPAAYTIGEHRSTHEQEPKRIWAGGEWLYWKANISPSYYAGDGARTLTSANFDGAFGNLQNQPFAYQSGYRLYLGGDFDKDYYGFNGQYTRFNNENHGSQSDTVDPITLLPSPLYSVIGQTALGRSGFAPTVAQSVPTNIGYNVRFVWDEADFTFVQHLMPSKTVMADLMMGFAWTNIRGYQGQFFQNQDYLQRYTQNWSFNGWGLTTKLASEWNIAYGFTARAFLTAEAFYGKSKLYENVNTMETYGAPMQEANFNANDYTVIGHGMISFGPAWGWTWDVAAIEIYGVFEMNAMAKLFDYGETTSLGGNNRFRGLTTGFYPAWINVNGWSMGANFVY